MKTKTTILLATALAVASIGLFGLRAGSETKTEWLGYAVYATEYQGVDPGIYVGGPPPTQWVDKGIEIGLREDGVLVWRKKTK